MLLYTLCLVCIGTSFRGTSVGAGYRRTPGSGRYVDTKGENDGKVQKMSVWAAS